jgi:TonB family protein
LLSLGEASIDGTAFDLRGNRVSGAFGTAIGTHALVGLVLWSLTGLYRTGTPSPQASESRILPFVFTGRAGESGGRSGGGNRSPEPAPLLRTRGLEAMAVSASSPLSLATPDTIAPEIDPAPALPVQPMDAGEFRRIGAVDGVPGPPTSARGPGDGGIGSQPGGDRGLGGVPGTGIGEEPYGIGNGVTAPDLIHRTQPQYTPDAMRAKVQGLAVLSGVVGIDGTLHEIRIARSLDATFGLDQEAIACVRQWRFRPGTRQGKPAAVYVTIEVAFTLR